MKETYTVRPRGHCAWAQGITTLTAARRIRLDAIQRGLTQPVYIIRERDGANMTDLICHVCWRDHYDAGGSTVDFGGGNPVVMTLDGHDYCNNHVPAKED